MTAPIEYIEYKVGHIKRNPETGAVAIRTIFPLTDDQFRAMAWLVATPNIGARNASTGDVETWEDLYIPPVDTNG
jgi:hypothetical protein